MKQLDFVSQLARLEKAFARPYGHEQSSLMYSRFRDVPLRAMVVAVDDMIIEERFLPKFREMHATIMKVMGARGWKREAKELSLDPKDLFQCHWCEDSGIRLRCYRRDLIRDFYCACATAKSMKQHDWTTQPARSAIIVPDHITNPKDRITFKFNALRAAMAAERSSIVDLATGHRLNVFGEDNLSPEIMSAVRLSLAKKSEEEIPF